MTAPPYTAQVDNVIKLQKSEAVQITVGTMTSTPGPSNKDKISIRGSQLQSPYGTYAAYLAEALKQELSLAGKYAATASRSISAELLRNDVSAAIGDGHGEIEARFVVRDNGDVRYDQIKTAGTTFSSPFMGAIAIPNAVQAYPALVQQLLLNLFDDPAFLNALK